MEAELTMARGTLHVEVNSGIFFIPGFSKSILGARVQYVPHASCYSSVFDEAL